jgi:transcriptional regulator with XRE-family HTH domain
MRRIERAATNDRSNVDAHVGQQVRRRRNFLGLSQSDVAAALSVTFQQVQKYERGTSRLSASRLLQLSELLRVPVAYFFAGLPGYERSDGEEELASSVAEDRQALQLVRHFHAIPGDQPRQEFLELVRALGRSTR